MLNIIASRKRIKHDLENIRSNLNSLMFNFSMIEFEIETEAEEIMTQEIKKLIKDLGSLETVLVNHLGIDY